MVVIINDTYHSDTIIYNLGDGHDTLYLSSVSDDSDNTQGHSFRHDVLKFGEGISVEDISFGLKGNDLILYIKKGTEEEGSLTIKDSAYYLDLRIETIEFNDGQVLTKEDMQELIGSPLEEGTENNDILSEKNGQNIDSGAGNDMILGSSRDNILIGGEGNDILNGGYGKDTLIGGTGNDTLGGVEGSKDYIGSQANYSDIKDYEMGNIYNGGEGNDTINDTYHSDTIIYNLGDGHDKLNLIVRSEEPESSNSVSRGRDVVQFGSEISPEDVTFNQIGMDLVIKIAEGTENEGSITIDGWFLEYGSVGRVEAFEFSDGTLIEWDEIEGLSIKEYNEITGTSSSDELIGTVGNDHIDGGYNNDILNGGDGDEILGGSKEERNGLDHQYYYNAHNTGNTYIGGKGDDTIIDSMHSDNFIYNLGDGHDIMYLDSSKILNGNKKDILTFGSGITKEDVSFEKQGDSLIIRIAEGTGNEGSINIKNWFSEDFYDSNNKIEEIRFDSGETISYLDIANEINSQLTEGTEESDYIENLLDLTNINGGAGDDFIQGSKNIKWRFW